MALTAAADFIDLWCVCVTEYLKSRFSASDGVITWVTDTQCPAPNKIQLARQWRRDAKIAKQQPKQDKILEKKT